MFFNKNLFRDSAVIEANDELFRITPTHWLKRKRAWSSKWTEVTAIEAVLAEPGDIGFVFQLEDGRQASISEDMTNWPIFLEAVRKRFPDLDWSNFERARQNLYTRLLCWKRT